MPNLLSAGIGGTSGASLTLTSPLLLNQRVYYVHATDGDSNYSGKDRKTPLTTIQEALTAIGANNDHIIVCLDGHTEEITSTMTLTQRVSILGEGSSAGVPTVQLITAHASNKLFQINVAGCTFSNLWFRPPGQAASPLASTAHHIFTAQDGLWLDGCYFDSDKNSNQYAVELSAGADYCRLSNCYFRSTETSTAAADKPYPGMYVAGAIAALRMDGCVFDGGTVGYEDGSGNMWAFDGSGAATTGLYVERLSLLRGADFKVHSNSSGYVNPQTTTGHAKVEW